MLTLKILVAIFTLSINKKRKKWKKKIQNQ